MKKLLIIFGVIGLTSTTGATNMLAYNVVDNIEEINKEDYFWNSVKNQKTNANDTKNIWENVDLNHRVEVQATGIHTEYDTKIKTKSSAKIDFKEIKNCK